jgi:DNA-binding transcriptional MerR regulator
MTMSKDLNHERMYKMAEASTLTGVKPYVLRFWETEFEDLNPITNEDGDKIFKSQDIQLIQKIKKLLFDEKYSIEKARAYLILEKRESLKQSQVAIHAIHLDSEYVDSQASVHITNSCENKAGQIESSSTQTIDLNQNQYQQDWKESLEKAKGFTQEALERIYLLKASLNLDSVHLEQIN